MRKILFILLFTFPIFSIIPRRMSISALSSLPRFEHVHIVAFNPDSEHPPVTRANGITTVLVVPTGELIAGQSALMMLDGWTWEEMTLKAPVGLHIYWPRMIPPSTVRFSRQSPEELKKETERRLQLIRETFQKARAYKKAKESEAQKGIPYHETDLKYEAMIPVLEGKVPVFVHANSSKEILSAIEWAESENKLYLHFKPPSLVLLCCKLWLLSCR